MRCAGLRCAVPAMLGCVQGRHARVMPVTSPFPAKPTGSPDGGLALPPTLLHPHCSPADAFELKKRALHVYAEKQRVPEFRCGIMLR